MNGCDLWYLYLGCLECLATEAACLPTCMVSHTLHTACPAYSANNSLLAASPAIREDHQLHTISSNGSFFAQSQFCRDEQSQARDVVPSNCTANNNICGTRARPAASTPPSGTQDTATPSTTTASVDLGASSLTLCAHRARPLSTALDSASLSRCMEPAVAKRIWRGHPVKCAPHLFEPHHHLSG